MWDGWESHRSRPGAWTTDKAVDKLVNGLQTFGFDQLEVVLLQCGLRGLPIEELRVCTFMSRMKLIHCAQAFAVSYIATLVQLIAQTATTTASQKALNRVPSFSTRRIQLVGTRVKRLARKAFHCDQQAGILGERPAKVPRIKRLSSKGMALTVVTANAKEHTEDYRGHAVISLNLFLTRTLPVRFAPITSGQE